MRAFLKKGIINQNKDSSSNQPKINRFHQRGNCNEPSKNITIGQFNWERCNRKTETKYLNNDKRNTSEYQIAVIQSPAFYKKVSQNVQKKDFNSWQAENIKLKSNYQTVPLQDQKAKTQILNIHDFKKKYLNSPSKYSQQAGYLQITKSPIKSTLQLEIPSLKKFPSLNTAQQKQQLDIPSILQKIKSQQIKKKYLQNTSFNSSKTPSYFLNKRKEQYSLNNQYDLKKILDQSCKMTESKQLQHQTTLVQNLQQFLTQDDQKKKSLQQILFISQVNEVKDGNDFKSKLKSIKIDNIISKEYCRSNNVSNKNLTSKYYAKSPSVDKQFIKTRKIDRQRSLDNHIPYFLRVKESSKNKNLQQLKMNNNHSFNLQCKQREKKLRKPKDLYGINAKYQKYVTKPRKNNFNNKRVMTQNSNGYKSYSVNKVLQKTISGKIVFF